MEKRPFTIYVQPVHRLYPCEVRKAEEARGMIGFHKLNCPDCRREPEGFELWGENGHLQGRFLETIRPTDEELQTWAARCRFSSPTRFVHRENGHTYYA